MKALLWGIVVIIILVFGVWYLGNKPAEAPVITGTSVKYFCASGKSMEVTYAGDMARALLSDERELTLTQAPSGSGTRYESGTIALIGKGPDAYLMEGSEITFENCLAGTAVNSGTSTSFTDSTQLFSFTFPQAFMLSGSGGGYSQNWKTGSTTLGLILAVVDVPREFQPKTNFSEAKFTVGTSADPAAIVSCLTEGNGNTATSATTTINGTIFSKIAFADAGAGNRYDTTSYRAMKDGQCYAVEYTIHSTNIGNYSPDQGITEFDEAKVEGALEAMVQSFKFIK